MAQVSKGLLRIVCYLRSHKLEEVKTAIAATGVSGMTVSDVRGCGNSPESAAWFGTEGFLVPLPIRSKIEVVIPESRKDDVVATILENAQTGEHGDGKIFVERITDAIRIRTKERGSAAV